MPTKSNDADVVTVRDLRESAREFRERVHTVIGTANSEDRGIRIDLRRPFEILQRIETGAPAQSGFGALGTEVIGVRCELFSEYPDRSLPSLKKGDKIMVKGRISDPDIVTLLVSEVSVLKRSLITPGSTFDMTVDAMFPNTYDFMVRRLALPSNPKELAKGVNGVAAASLLDEAETKRLRVDVFEELIRQGWVRRARDAKKLLRIAFDDLSITAQKDVVKHYKRMGIRTDKLESRIRRRGRSD